MITTTSNERDELKLLGDALVSELGVNVILGIENKVTFEHDNTVSLTLIGQERQRSNEVHYPDRVGTVTDEADRVDLFFSNLTFQIDCYGMNSLITANAISMLVRCETMLGHGITPLFCTNPVNLTFIDGAENNVRRWTLDAAFQFNVAYRQSQDSALELKADVVNIQHQ